MTGGDNDDWQTFHERGSLRAWPLYSVAVPVAKQFVTNKPIQFGQSARSPALYVDSFLDLDVSQYVDNASRNFPTQSWTHAASHPLVQDDSSHDPTTWSPADQFDGRWLDPATSGVGSWAPDEVEMRTEDDALSEIVPNSAVEHACSNDVHFVHQPKLLPYQSFLNALHEPAMPLLLQPAREQRIFPESCTGFPIATGSARAIPFHMLHMPTQSFPPLTRLQTPINNAKLPSQNTAVEQLGVELVLDALTLEAVATPEKRRKRAPNQEQIENRRLIAVLGGACRRCRKSKRQCHPSHHRRSSSASSTSRTGSSISSYIILD